MNMLKKIVLTLIYIFIINYLEADDSWKIYNVSELADIYITIESEDLEWIYNNVESDSLHPVTVIFQNEYIDETLDSVGFRLRGNTSRSAQKKSFKLDFNHFISGRDFYGVEKLNLNGEHNDPSIFRSKLSWDFFQEIDMISSRASYVKVYINDEYYGLYISLEHIDDTFLKRNYNDDSGNLWKCTWPADLSYRGENQENYHPYYGDDRPYELKTNTDQNDFSKLARLIRIINDSPDSLEMVLNIKETIQYFALNVLFGNWDDYRFLKNNFYLYHNPTDDLIHWIPYDYDNSFGVDWFDINWSSVSPYQYPVIDNDGRPLTEYLFSQDRYLNMLTHFLEFYNEKLFNIDSLDIKVNSFKDYLFSAAEDDMFRTLDYGFTIDDFENSYSYNYQEIHVKEGILEFITNRRSYLEGQIQYQTIMPIIYEVTLENSLVNLNTSVKFNVSAFGNIENFHIFYLKEGESSWQNQNLEFAPDLMSNKIEDHDKWIASIDINDPGLYYWYITASNENGIDRYPVYDFKTFELIDFIDNQDIIINEILAKNENINVDESGDYDDWFELKNISNINLNLSNYYLTDKIDNLQKWRFPDSNVIIEANNFMLIWCDEEQEEGYLHTNFKLSSEGEFIALVAPDGETIIDSISFPSQYPDTAYGLIDSDIDNWVYVSPSPGYDNSLLTLNKQHSISNKFFINNLYPNPFNSTINMKIILEDNIDEFELNLISLNGRIISSNTFNSKGLGEHVYEIQFNNLFSSGMYILEVKNGFHRQTRKILYLK